MKELYTGIDLGVEVCAWHAVGKEGQTEDKGEFRTCEKLLIDAVTSLPGKVMVLMEECELANWAYRTILPHVEKAIVCDPRHNAWVAKASNKSDSIDAHKLAELLRVNRFVEVYNPANETMVVFKKCVQQMDRFSLRVAREKVRLKSQLRRLGISTADENPYTDRGMKKLVERVGNPDMEALLAQIFRTMRFLEGEKKDSIARLRTFVPRIPILADFLDVPGVGIQTASLFVAYIQTPDRFKGKRNLVKYCGLGIVKRSSDGKPIGRERLDRQANLRLKDVSRKIFMGAMACRKDNLFKRTYRKSLKRTENKEHARLNTQRKILTVLWAMWKDGTKYDDTINPA